jgi:hypothetical protein
LKFTVERKPDDFEDVIADTWVIKDGWLLFYQYAGGITSRFVIGYPPQEVVTFFPED